MVEPPNFRSSMGQAKAPTVKAMGTGPGCRATPGCGILVGAGKQWPHLFVDAAVLNQLRINNVVIVEFTSFGIVAVTGD